MSNKLPRMQLDQEADERRYQLRREELNGRFGMVAYYLSWLGCSRKNAAQARNASVIRFAVYPIGGKER